MPIDVLVPLVTYPDPLDQAALGPLVDYVDVLEPTLTAVPIEVDIPPVSSPFALGADYTVLSRQAESGSREVAREFGTRLRELTERAGVLAFVTPVRSQPLSIPTRIAELARTHDLTIVPYDPEIADSRAIAEAAMFSSGRPVLVFPVRPLEVLEPDVVAIAWDGSRAAARALNDARVWLQKARRVLVLAVTDDKAMPDDWAAGVLAHLERVGIKAEPVTGRLEGRAVGEALQRLALSQDATLLVMGAYGHNRLREFLLGGATRSVLERPLLPVLMSY